MRHVLIATLEKGVLPHQNCTLVGMAIYKGTTVERKEGWCSKQERLDWRGRLAPLVGLAIGTGGATAAFQCVGRPFWEMQLDPED